MSVTGVGSGSTVPDPSTVDSTSTSTAPTTDPAALDFGAFTGHPVFAEILAGNATLGMGAVGPEVTILEETLIALGYGIVGRGQPNENLTIGTVNALTRFQNDKGLTPSGVLDVATMAALDDTAAATLGAAPAPAEPKPTDLVPQAILERYGLSTEKMTTESHYEGEEWGSTGYFPYDGDVQYIAFAKHRAVFGGDAGADAHGYFEFYSNPPSDLRPGSWIGSGYIRESDFESTAGIDVTASRVIDNDAYRLLREAGAPDGSKFALRTADDKQIPVQDGDALVPTVIKDGAPVELTVDGHGSYDDAAGNDVGWGADVTWRIKRDGAVLYGDDHKSETRNALTGVDSGVAFDFLDERGDLVGFNADRDRIVETWKDGEDWNVLAKKDDGTFEHQVIKDGAVSSTDAVDAAQAETLRQGKDIIHRVQVQSSHELKGDGEVGERFNMGWWGKCHNVASLSTTDMPKPQSDVTVITNLAEGDEAALQWGDNVLVPQRGQEGAISGYAHQVRAADGSVQSSTDLTIDEANGLAGSNDARPVIVAADGSLKPAESTRFDTESLTALVAHVGDGAVQYVGGAGSRYYARPDILVKKDGTQIEAHIKDVKLEDGTTERVGTRSGTEFSETTRDPLRSPEMDSRIIGDGSGRRYAFNINNFENINKHREDTGKSKISELILVKPDGTEETVKAEDIDIFGWENKFDFRPDELWDLHKTITKESSTVIETYAGTQVWNYSATDMQTTVVDPKDLGASEIEAAKKPGMMTGTVDEAGKTYFETALDTDGGSKRMRYWVRFSEAGDIEDYAYLTTDVPDFIWTQLVKKGEAWTGESQAPGVMNGDVQRLYFASNGQLKTHMLPGGVITTADLKTASAADQ
jgi:hypothetical protein